jgi:hypothetical protein
MGETVQKGGEKRLFFSFSRGKIQGVVVLEGADFCNFPLFIGFVGD